MSLTAQEQQILDSIVVASENDPHKPEFPPHDPRFPATPTYQIQVPGFDDVRLKDESVNPTGTHKDRMAWEIVVTYRDFLLAKKAGSIDKLPKMSLISSGSAAIAIQHMLHAYHLPNLKVLIDSATDDDIIAALRYAGCEVYQTDLSKKVLLSKEILALTNNTKGFDITSSEAFDPTERFYDWLSYEILNTNPDYCFIPFGSGHLFENVLSRSKKEILASHGDPRCSADLEHLRRCHFLGATTNNPKSKASKLYSPHTPFLHFDEQRIRMYRMLGVFGDLTNVYVIREEFLDQAMTIAHEQGIAAEYSGISGLALLLQIQDEIPKDKKILIVNTGKTKYNGSF